MRRYDLWFIILLPFTFCSHNKAETPEQLVKTIGKEADFTPVCSNKTQNMIVMVVCRIRPVRSREEECLLFYRLKKGFEQECDSRFLLISINQTLFLQLNNLTPENRGNLTCQCAFASATFTLELNITVEDEDTTSHIKTTSSMDLIVVTALVLVFISITGVVVAFIYRKISPGNRLEALNWHELSSTVLYKEALNAEPDHFKQEEAEFYSKAKMVCCHTRSG